MNTVQILIQYQDDNDRVLNESMELSIDELRAIARYLSSTRISDVPLDAVVRIKQLYDKMVALDKLIKQL